MRCRRISRARLRAVDHLLRASEALRRPIAIRLVKGAYWDAEIKRAQELGMAGFPVFTRKWATDVSFLAVARRLLSHPAPVYPQFATHNALTVASIIEFASELTGKSGSRRYEFQRLHGMGDPLYDALLADQPDARVRVYAPVGEFRDLLAYLVRRLLENGANTSFVHQITDRSVPSELLVNDVYEQARSYLASINRRLRCQPAAQLFAGTPQLAWHRSAIRAHVAEDDRGGDACRTHRGDTSDRRLDRPLAVERCSQPRAARRHRWVRWSNRPLNDAIRAVDAASASMRDWDALGVDARAAIIDRVADAWEAAHDELAALIVREAGRTMLDAHLEVREAIDFCRYYAALGARADETGAAAWPRRRVERIAARRTRRVRLHQPVEFSAGHIRWTDRRGTRCRQQRGCEARRANSADCFSCGPIDA